MASELRWWRQQENCFVNNKQVNILKKANCLSWFPCDKTGEPVTLSQPVHSYHHNDITWTAVSPFLLSDKKKKMSWEVFLSDNFLGPYWPGKIVYCTQVSSQKGFVKQKDCNFLQHTSTLEFAYQVCTWTTCSQPVHSYHRNDLTSAAVSPFLLSDEKKKMWWGVSFKR